MIAPKHIEAAGEVLRDEPMDRHTSWRVGGPAEMFFKPASAHALAAFLEGLPEDVPVHWVGLGSNLLVRDGGLKGVVIATHGVLGNIERLTPETVRAESGVACAKLARQCARWELGPAEFFAGIPGTLGGALTMNAGAFGGETWEHVKRVEVIDRHGSRRTRDRSEYRIGYRHVEGPGGEWFVAAEFAFQRDPGAADSKRIRTLLERRKATQPIGRPSCGSVFRNPPGDHAARLIEAAGLKGYRIGGASVSAKHANFIINEGDASARDVEALIEHVRERVEAVHGVRLEPEVHIVGEPS